MDPCSGRMGRCLTNQILTERCKKHPNLLFLPAPLPPDWWKCEMKMLEAIFQSHSCSIIPQLGTLRQLSLVLVQVLRYQETSLPRENSYLVFVLGLVTLSLFVEGKSLSNLKLLWSQQALERCQRHRERKHQDNFI